MSMEPGETCICQHDDWYNAFGDKTEAVHRGMRLKVTGRRNIGGSVFFTFEEVEKGNWFLGVGFKPMRTLN